MYVILRLNEREIQKKNQSRESNLRIDFQFSWGTFNLNSFENELTLFTEKNKENKSKRKTKNGEKEKEKKEKKRKTFCLNPHVRKVNFK